MQDLQHQLAQTQLEKAAVLAELENLREAVGQQPAPPQRVTLQLNVREAEARTEVALLQRGVDCDTAHALAVLEGKLQEAQEREALALQKLEDASAALAAAPSGAPEPALETELGGEQPDEGGDPGPSGREAIEEVVESIQAEKQEIEAQMRDVAAAAASVAPLALAHPVAEDSFVEELPPAVAEALSEVAAAARAGAPAEGEEEEQGESVGALAPAAEDRLQELIARLRAAGTSGAAAAPVSQPSETAAAAPVVLNLNVNAPNEEPAPAPVVLNLAIKDAEARAEQTVPAAYEPVAPVVLNVAVASDADGRELSLKEQRIRELEHMLQDMALEEDRLRSDLELLQPVRLNFTLAGNDPGAAPGTGMSRRSSNGSLNSADNVAQDRAEAEAAWQEHVKKSDVPALLRTKAELETKCHMLESQLEKAQAALAAADREKGLFQESIDDAIKKGDVGILTGLRDGLRTSTARMMSGSKGFGVFKRKGGVSRKEIKTALHVSSG